MRKLFFTLAFMKFTQQDAFKKIKSILTRGGKDLQMSERSIMEQIDSLSALIANDEMELDDFIAKVEPTFKTMNGNAKKDYSDFVNKWKEEHPDQNPDTQQNTPAQANPELDALKAEIEELKKANAENELKSKLSAKKTELLGALESKGVKDKEWIESFLSEVNITEDIDVESKAESYVKLYNKSKADVPPTPTPGQPNNDGNDDLSSLKQASEMAKLRDAQLSGKI